MANKRARISDRNPLTATDSVLNGFEQVNKLASQQPKLAEQIAELTASEQVEKLGSQQVDKPIDRGDLTAIPDQMTTEEAEKLASQQVGKSQITSQLAEKLASQEVDEPELLEDRSKSDKLASQQPEQSASQQVSKPIIRKATFQIDATILADLDRYHLQLQIEMGRRNAPYKEILVEEAIAQWLERAAKSPDRAVKSLIKRQEQRG